MTDYLTGEIILWPCPRVPQNWHECDGSLVPISEYPELFALIGTIFGGDGTTDFALPNLRGRVAIGQGQGEGLSERVIGAMGGEGSVTLTEAQIPQHTHTLYATSTAANTSLPISAVLGALQDDREVYFNPPATSPPTPTPMGGSAISIAGSNQPHTNLMPLIGILYIICLMGTNPMRSSVGEDLS